MKNMFFLYGDDLNLISNKLKEISHETTIEKCEIASEEELKSFISNGCEIPLFIKKTTLQVFLNIKKIKIEDDLLNEFIEFLKISSGYKNVVVISQLEKSDKATLKTFIENPLYKALETISNVEQYVQIKPWEKEETKKTEELYLALINKKFQGVFNLISEVISLKNPLYVLAVLQSKFRQALEIKANLESGKTKDQIVKLIAIHPYKLELELKKIGGIMPGELKDIILLLSDTEFKLKQGLIKEENMLDVLCLRLAPVNK